MAVADAAAPPRHPPMAATATLTNCYVPLPVAPPPEAATPPAFDPLARPADDRDGGNAIGRNGADDGDGDGQRAASARRRGPRTLRRIHLDRSVLSQSTGSALVEWGHTKLVASVRGPRPTNCSSLNAANHGGGLVCEGERKDVLHFSLL